MLILDKAIEQAKALPAVYVIVDARNKYRYKGSCRNLRKRLSDHRAGRVSRTKNRRPLNVVFFEYCKTYTEARRLENFLKTGAGGKYIKAGMDRDA